MRCITDFSIVSIGLSLVACGGPRAAERAHLAEAKLVVAVVIDQLGSTTLERYLPHLPEDGALRRLITTGAYHHRVVYAHATTYTAAGHASIHTGATPSTHGVLANERWSRERAETIAWVDDSEHAVFGRDDWFASPATLRVGTVADALRAAHGRTTRVVALSLKDRGSVIPGGRTPDAVAFWDSRYGRFTSSTFYSAVLPEWLADFVERHPPPYERWTPADRDLLAVVNGADDQPGEGGWEGLDATFPHDPNEGENPASGFRATPQASEYLLDLARAAVETFDLGGDDVPDLLSLSISGTDYVGHTFGPHSWEYLDHLIRVDRALGRFLAELEAERGPIAILVTSDHGHAPLPEERRANESAGRLLPESIAATLEAALEYALGAGEWIEAFVQPFVYLTPAAEARRDEVVPLCITALAQMDGVHAAYDVRERRRLERSADPIERAVAASLRDDAPGAVLVVPAEHWFVDDEAPPDRGTSHGTPWPYDREVPVIFAGPEVAHLDSHEPRDQRRVARTLAALLGIPGPEAAPARPLPGAPNDG